MTTIRDNRLDRELHEMIAQTTTLTERDLRSYRPEGYEDADHALYAGQIDELVERLEDDENSRRAIAIADSPVRCMVGVHVLLRDKIHVLSWLRASDAAEYRDEDIGFLYWYGRQIRKKMGINDRIMVHIFTSSLHDEVDDLPAEEEQ